MITEHTLRGSERLPIQVQNVKFNVSLGTESDVFALVGTKVIIMLAEGDRYLK